jgi:hypothetical protein
LVKNGTGTLTATSILDAPGGLTINAGELQVTGSITGAITVASGATLSGNETTPGTGTTGAVTANGNVSPGANGVGTLNIVGDLTLAAGCNYNVDLTDAGNDQLNVTGAVDLAGAALNVASTQTAMYGVFVLINNDGSDAVNGTFADMPEGASITVNGQTYSITYCYDADSSQLAAGNDVALVGSHRLQLDSVASPTRTATPTITGVASHNANDSNTIYLEVYGGTVIGGDPIDVLHVTSDTVTGAFSAIPSLTSGTYTVRAAQYSPSGTAWWSDPITLTVDSVAPKVSEVSSSASNGVYVIDDVISITVTYSEPIIVSGTPQLLLATGRTGAAAVYQSGTGTNVLTFSYTVVSGDEIGVLDYLSPNALDLHGGTIRDSVGNDAILELPVPGQVGSLGANKALAIGMFTACITANTSGSTLAQEVDYTVTFNSPVSGVDVGDFVVDSHGLTGITYSVFTQSSTTYIVRVATGIGDGDVTLRLLDDDSIADALGLKLGGVGVGNGNTDGPSYRIDRTPPSVPANLDSSSQTVGAVLLTWTPSSDASGSRVEYQVLRDATLVATVSDTEYLDTGLSSDTTYTYTVQAVDTAGNVSAPSDLLAVDTPEGSSAGPAITLPTDQTLAEGQDLVFDLSFTDSDESGPWAITVTWGDCLTPETFQATSPGTYQLHHLYTNDGVHHVRAAVTNSNNETDSVLFTNTLADVPPTLDIIGPSSIEEGDTYYLSLQSSDPGSDQLCGWQINWGDGAQTSVAGDTLCVTHIYSPGTYSISAYASDDHGTYSAATSVTVANLAPILRLDASTTITEGSSCDITLCDVDRGGATVSQWSVYWGDGTGGPVSGSSLSHQYTTGTGTYTISALACSSQGGQYRVPNTATIGVIPQTPSSLSATAVAGTSEQILLSWTNTSQLATAIRLEQSTDAMNYTLVTTVSASTSSYTFSGLTASTDYYFRICAVDDAGQSTYAQTSGRTNNLPTGDLSDPDTPHSVLVDIGMNLNFYGMQFSHVYVNRYGNLTLSEPLTYYQAMDPLKNGYANRVCSTPYGAIIAPFFADVDLGCGIGHGTLTYTSTVVGGRPAWEADWNNVDYFNVDNMDYSTDPPTPHNSKYNTFSVALVDRSDVMPGDFDIVFKYNGLEWDTGDDSCGKDGLATVKWMPDENGNPLNPIRVPIFSARAGYSNGSGDDGTYYELPGSGTPGGLLGLSGSYTYPIRNLSVGLTAYRTGGNYGTAVSADDQRSGDPSNYVILVNNNYEQDADGEDTDVDFNTGLLGNGQTVDISDHDLARITLTQPQSPGGTPSGTVSLALSNSASARIFDSTGHLLSSGDLTAALGGSGYLAGLASGDVDVYVEGLRADPDFSLTYSCVDTHGGLQASTSVHMVIADISYVNLAGHDLSLIYGGLLQDDLLGGIGLGDAKSMYDFYESLASSLFKITIDGLHSNQIDQLMLSSADNGDSFVDSLTDRIQGAESQHFAVLYDDEDSSGLSTAQRNSLRSAYQIGAVSDGNVLVAFETDKDQQERPAVAETHAWTRLHNWDALTLPGVLSSSSLAPDKWSDLDNYYLVEAGSSRDTLEGLAQMITRHREDAKLLRLPQGVEKITKGMQIDVRPLLVKLQERLLANVEKEAPVAKNAVFPPDGQNSDDVECIDEAKLKQIFGTGGTKSKYDCAAMINIIFAKALADCLNHGDYDRLKIPTGGTGAAKKLTPTDISQQLCLYVFDSNILNVKPGYATYFWNNRRYYRGGWGSWAGENVIKVGDKYAGWAEPMETKTYDEWKERLASEFNKELYFWQSNITSADVPGYDGIFDASDPVLNHPKFKPGYSFLYAPFVAQVLMESYPK